MNSLSTFICLATILAAFAPNAVGSEALIRKWQIPIADTGHCQISDGSIFVADPATEYLTAFSLQGEQLCRRKTYVSAQHMSVFGRGISLLTTRVNTPIHRFKLEPRGPSKPQFVDVPPIHRRLPSCGYLLGESKSRFWVVHSGGLSAIEKETEEVVHWHSDEPIGDIVATGDRQVVIATSSRLELVEAVEEKLVKVKTIQMPNQSEGVWLHCDEQSPKFLHVGNVHGAIRTIDLESGKTISEQNLELPGSISCVSAQATLPHFALATENDGIAIISFNEAAAARPLYVKTGTSSVSSIAQSGRYIATVSNTRILTLWELSNEE